MRREKPWYAWSRRSMVVDVKKLIGQSVVGFLLCAVPLFLAAGTLAWWAGWIFLALLVFCIGVYTAWMYVNRPELLRERMELSQPDQKTWDKVFLGIVLLYAIAWLIVMPLDAVRHAGPTRHLCLVEM